MIHSNIPQRPLRAGGNLNYPELMRLIEKTWLEAMGPEIPFISRDVATEAEYPCVVYSVASKTIDPKDKRPKQREVLRHLGSDSPTEGARIIYGQRHIFFVRFRIMDKVSPDGSFITEELTERFEDFMMEFTPFFMWAGVADMDYERRTPDEDETRKSDDIASRSVIYRIVLERHKEIDVARIRKVIASISLPGGVDEIGATITS